MDASQRVPREQHSVSAPLSSAYRSDRAFTQLTR